MITREQVYPALHFGCVVATGLTALISFLVRCAQPPERRKTNTRSRITLRFLLTAALVCCYVAEEILLATGSDGSAVAQAQQVHLVVLALFWLVAGFKKNDLSYETRDSATTTAVFETPILALSFLQLDDDPRRIGQLVAQACRLAILVAIVIINCQATRANKTWDADYSPLLANGDQTPEERSYGTEPRLENLDEDDDNDSDDDDSEAIESRSKKLQAAGGWWAYFKGFAPLLPFLIPRNDRKVQICLLINVVLVIARRAMNVLIPSQLGLVTDKLLDKKPPYRELAIWLLLEILNGSPGIGLLDSLSKIPIEQFSYRQITNAAFSHVMSLSMDFHSERDSAEVLKAVEQGGSLTSLLETVVLDIGPTLIDLVVAFTLLYWKFNSSLALVLMVATVGYVSLEVASSTWNVENRRESNKAEREETRVMYQAVQGWQTVSYFNMFSFERNRIGQAVDDRLEKDSRWTKCSAYIGAVMGLTMPATLFTLACLVLHEISQGRKSPGDFIFLVQYWRNLVYPIQSISYKYRWLMSDLVGAERLLELFQTKPSIVDREGATQLEAVKGVVEFKHVDFSYDARKPTLTDISFSAQPGETVALVGQTGAGKSSITKLLLRLYDVGGGSVEIDGRDVRDVTLGSLRGAFGVVPQDPMLFNASIAENLRYARPGAAATDAELADACRAAAVHDRIASFPAGYATRVGENGVKLSGGEVQRLAIARVFLRDPRVLVLDEATSAVDTDTEAEIQGALDRLRAGRTTLVIAHRLSTVVGADRIIVLHEGRIAETGSHQELLRQGGRYSRLWSKQIAGVGKGDLISLES
ncbi:P-loop containing nucleoside triphosphate hydrolase protein [Biscogniauxia mediterranea]|nr:P-loop containing nucleoside triphosphate hydrolase protein [Biscogniauxia mediterranea]